MADLHAATPCFLEGIAGTEPRDKAHRTAVKCMARFFNPLSRVFQVGHDRSQPVADPYRRAQPPRIKVIVPNDRRSYFCFYGPKST